MIKKIISLFIIIMMICSNVSAYTKPKDISFTDYKGMVSDGVKNYVKEKNEILFNKVKAKIIFVTTDSFESDTAADYAKNLYSSWNISSLGRGNSVFIVMSESDYGIVQGNNIKRILTDNIICDKIYNSFEKDFAKGNYDIAVMKLYNDIGKWYENHYENLNLQLDDSINKYITNTFSKDEDKNPKKILMWIGTALILILIIVFLKIKKRIDFNARKKERQIKRKTANIDIDKLINM